MKRPRSKPQGPTKMNNTRTVSRYKKKKKTTKNISRVNSYKIFSIGSNVVNNTIWLRGLYRGSLTQSVKHHRKKKHVYQIKPVIKPGLGLMTNTLSLHQELKKTTN